MAAAAEGKAKLSFQNISVQSQGAYRLRLAVSQKLAHGKILQDDNQEIPELNILLEKSADSSLNVSLECSMAVVELVKEGRVDFNYILTKFLNILPSTSNKSGIIQAIASLLVFQIKFLEHQNGVYECPYAIRTHPHPFITILKNQPESGQLLVEKVGVLLNTTHRTYCDSHKIFKMLKPFFLFVLGDPRRSFDTSLKHHLQSVLLDATALELIAKENMQDSVQKSVLDFLTSMVPCYKFDSQSIGQTTFLVHQLAEWFLYHALNTEETSSFNTTKVFISSVERIVDHLLCLCSARLQNSLDFMSTLLVLRRIQKQFSEVFVNARTIWAINILLVESPVFYSQELMNIWKEIIVDRTKDLDIYAASLGAVIPLLQLVSSNCQPVKHLATKYFAQLDVFKCHKDQEKYQEMIKEISKEPSTKCSPAAALPSEWLVQMDMCANITNRILRDDEAAITWLKGLQTSLSSSRNVPSHVSLILSVILVIPEPRISREVLKVLPLLFSSTPSQSLWFLPLLLCKLGQETDADLKLQILYTIPELATHKICVGPLLKTIQSLSMSPPLRPVSLRLLHKLWHRQSRVFPHLQKALSSDDADVKDSDLLTELQIAKAATIRDICTERPSQHGADLLGLLSSLINTNARHRQAKDDSSSIVVVLSLQGIKALCQAEVVDLCTAWRALASKLAQDTRPAAIKGLCELFGLTPSLPTDTQEYQEFKMEVIVFLWKMTQHKTPFVAGAAFDALSKFDRDDFKLFHLPEEISGPIKQKLMSSRKSSNTEQDVEALEQSVDNSPPPGVAYMALLSKVHPKTMSDFQTFLTSLLKQEVASIPRGLVHNAMRANPSHDRVMTGIPSFLQSQYDKSKTPGLNAGLAVGILFCFEPPFQQHDGKRRRRYHVDCARSYRHMLDSLLHEVPIQPSEWHRNLLLPQAWTVFMTRLYNTCVMGRKEELALQFSHGHITDEKELQEKQNNAWLVTRDRLTEQLQAASRGNPSVQGNSVLALAGLAFAVSSYKSQESTENQSNQSDGAVQGEERHRTRDWLCVIADTLMVVLDGNYKAKTSPLVWCQQVSSSTSSASSLLARACAALSMSQLVPVLVTLDPERVKVFTEALKQRVPGQPKAGSSSVIQSHCSLGLGLLLSKLYQEHFSELAGNEGYMMMTTALDVLEDAALSRDLENTEGACLGMGLALSALCRENIVDSRVHLLTMHQKLKALIQDYGQDSAEQRLQTLSFSFSLITVNAYHTGILSGQDATQCVPVLKDLSTKNNQAVGVSLSLGLLLHGLVIGGHAGVTEFVTQQLKIWETWIENQDLPSLQQLAGANGLMGLLGSEQAFFQIETSATDPEIVGKGKPLSILKTLKNFISAPHDVGVASNIAWLLGHIYSAATSSSITKASVPANYSYLPEKSILRAVFDFLLAAGKTGPHLDFSSHVINNVLVSMVTGPEVFLPPVNWASVLGPIMRTSFGEETSRLCLQFAIAQAKSSSSLVSFLSSWLSTALFIGLQPECQKELYQSLSKLMYVVPSARLQEFLRGPVITGFDPFKDVSTSEAILRGVLSALQVNDPPQSVFGWISSTLKQIYESCSEDACAKFSFISELLANCLAQVPLDQVDFLTQIPNLKSVLVRCCLVGSGQAPLKWLNSCITWVLESANQDTADLMSWYIVKALNASKESNKHSIDDRLSWFTDVISQIRITATNNEQQTSAEAVTRGLAVLSGLSVYFSGSPVSFSIDSSSDHLKHTPSLYSIKRNLKKLLRLLSCSLFDVMKLDSWTRSTEKVLEWLFVMYETPAVQADRSLRKIIQECIIVFRNFEAFNKMSVWTEALPRIQGTTHY